MASLQSTIEEQLREAEGLAAHLLEVLGVDIDVSEECHGILTGMILAWIRDPMSPGPDDRLFPPLPSLKSKLGESDLLAKLIDGLPCDAELAQTALFGLLDLSTPICESWPSLREILTHHSADRLNSSAVSTVDELWEKYEAGWAAVATMMRNLVSEKHINPEKRINANTRIAVLRVLDQKADTFDRHEARRKLCSVWRQLADRDPDRLGKVRGPVSDLGRSSVEFVEAFEDLLDGSIRPATKGGRWEVLAGIIDLLIDTDCESDYEALFKVWAKALDDVLLTWLMGYDGELKPNAFAYEGALWDLVRYGSDFDLQIHKGRIEVIRHNDTVPVFTWGRSSSPAANPGSESNRTLTIEDTAADENEERRREERPGMSDLRALFDELLDGPGPGEVYDPTTVALLRALYEQAHLAPIRLSDARASSLSEERIEEALTWLADMRKTPGLGDLHEWDAWRRRYRLSHGRRLSLAELHGSAQWLARACCEALSIDGVPQNLQLRSPETIVPVVVNDLQAWTGRTAAWVLMLFPDPVLLDDYLRVIGGPRWFFERIQGSWVVTAWERLFSGCPWKKFSRIWDGYPLDHPNLPEPLHGFDLHRYLPKGAAQPSSRIRDDLPQLSPSPTRASMSAPRRSSHSSD